MNIDTIHETVVVSIGTDHPSRPEWTYRAINLTDDELRDLAALVRQVVDNFRPTTEK